MRIVPVSATAVLFAAAAFGQPPAKELMLHPAAEPVPALKYPLLPDIAVQTPGNAVTLYYRALLPDALTHRLEPDIADKMEKWRKTPLADLPVADMAWLRTYRPLQDCEAAARREHCDWDMTARLRKDGMSAPIGDVSSMRELARLLALRARLEMASGQHDKAVNTLQTLMAQSRHVAEGPTLIHALVALAGSGQGLEQLEDFVQTGRAPNLYWSLADLPRPFIDVRKAMQGERLMLVSAISTAAELPDLNELETRPLSARQVGRLEEWLKAWMNLEGPGAENKLKFAAELVRLLPAARRALIAAGHGVEDVNKLPPVQVIVAHGLREHVRLHGDAVKLTSLPYWEARPRLAELEKRLKADKLPTSNPQSGLSLVTAIQKVSAAQARVDRRIAALRCVEALRLHAAAHKGKLPERLADVKEVPVPIDPVTGKDFVYKLDGNRATLTGPAPEGEVAAPGNFLQYDLSIAR